MALTPTDPAKAQIWLRGEAPNQILDVYVPRGARGEIGPIGPQGPAVPTNMTVADTVTGPETAGATGPQGPQGLKGDPGGWVVGTSLGTTNLDLIVTDGIYRQNGPAQATLATNYPVANVTGILYVSQASTASYMVQTFHVTSGATTGGRVIYERIASNGVFTPWRAFTSSRIDETAGRVLYQWDEVNNREQLVYGDTGWRNIALDPAYGIVAAGDFFGRPQGDGAVVASHIKIRRVGSTVYIGGAGALQPKQDYSTATRSLCIIPSGFRGYATNEGLVCKYGNNSGDVAQRLVYVNIPDSSATAFLTVVPLLDSNWAGRPTGETYPKLYHGMWLTGSWHTNDPWPTTLPGTAAGAIPNA